MQLSKRLQAVADLVTPGSRVADVGCDHAYTSIYLQKEHISSRIIAMDVNQGPIDRAKENILRYGCEANIETRRSNGLEKLQQDEVDSILIAGMGGTLMISILSERLDILSSVKEVILQPQSEIFKVRQFLQDQRFCIIEENMMKEDGKYYVMMKAVPQDLVNASSLKEKLLLQEEHFHYGKLLLEARNETLKEFLLWDLSICEGIKNHLNNSLSEISQHRMKEINDRITLLQIGLGYYDEKSKG